MSISIYKYSKGVISNEIAGLNNAVLKQVSENVSVTNADSVNLCNKIAYDSKLIEFVKAPVISNKQNEELISEYAEKL